MSVYDSLIVFRVSELSGVGRRSSQFRGQIRKMAEVPTGTRFACTVCAAEFIVTKGGDADITCDGQPVVKK